MAKKRFFMRFFKPEESVPGLEIRDAAVRIAQLHNTSTLKKEAVLLGPGIIEQGKIKDMRRLISALKKLHSRFVGHDEKIPVIAIIPSTNVYTQAFSVPPLAEGKLEEAAKLNLATISPIDMRSAYADWQRIGFREGEAKIDLLGAFANRDAVDEYIEALQEAGFLPVAIEFPALAIARTVKSLAASIEIEKPQVVLNVSSDGIDFIALRHGNLYFDYFIPWKMMQGDGFGGREILFSDFKDTIVREIKKVSAFYSAHWEGRLEKIVLITQAFQDEIASFVKENFPFGVDALTLRNFPDLPPSWFGVLGSAIRGSMPRTEDNLISLTKLGPAEAYLEREIKIFAKFWRNIIISVLGFFAVLFVLSDSFVYWTALDLEQQLREMARGPEGAETVTLQVQARAFNQLVGKAVIAQEGSVPRSSLLMRVQALSRNNITLRRVSFDAERGTMLITGTASSEAAAIQFKNLLEEEGFSNVLLPLASITPNPDRTVSFTLTFQP